MGGIAPRRLTGVSGHEAFPVSRVPVANVKTVPQRSPLRYPGGKTWLVPHIREWLRKTTPGTLIEPFAGGAIVSLTAVMENLVPRAVMVERDRDVAAFWHAVLQSAPALAERVRGFEPTIERIRALEDTSPTDVLEHGFRTLVLNRTRMNGGLAAQASFPRRMASRWYPETLAKRLAAINEHRNRLDFFEGDGTALLPLVLRTAGRKTAVFLDPPYTAQGGRRAGQRLYTHARVDHARAFATLAQYEANFLMTCDTAPQIVDLVREHDFTAVNVSVKNGHHDRTHELVVTPEPWFTPRSRQDLPKASKA